MKLPISFIESTRALMGDEEYQKLSVALEQEPPVSVRLNSKFTDSLSCSSISGRIPWAAGGYYLNQRLTFTFDPLSGRMLLRAGGLVDVCGTGVAPVCHGSGENARSLRRSRGEVYSCPQPVAGREPVSGQRGHP